MISKNDSEMTEKQDNTGTVRLTPLTRALRGDEIICSSLAGNLAEEAMIRSHNDWILSQRRVDTASMSLKEMVDRDRRKGLKDALGPHLYEIVVNALLLRDAVVELWKRGPGRNE